VRDQLTEDRLRSLQEVVMGYRGVPKAVRRFHWVLVHRRTIHDDGPVCVPVPDTYGGSIDFGPAGVKGPTAVYTPAPSVDVFPGRSDRHGGWRFRFGFHSRARVAVLFLAED
jgi:hypothetical protein